LNDLMADTLMRKVLVFRNNILPMSETFIRQQALAMVRWHATLVGVFTVQPSLALAGVDFRVIEQITHLPRFGIAWRILRRLGLSDIILYKYLHSLNPSLVHVHFGVDAVEAWPAMRRLRVPIVVTLHGYDVNIHPDWWRSGQGGERLRNYPSDLLALATEPAVKFIAVSKAIRQRAISAYGIPAEKIEVLHIGVDNVAFAPGGRLQGERRPLVLFVGRLVEKKGAEVLIRAMETVQQHVKQAELLIIGAGPLRGSFENLAEKLNVTIEFLGVQPNSVVRQMLDQARVFCSPSITSVNGDAEGLPIVILEAQACGVPVITSAIGGRDEGIADGITGFAFPEGDHAALAEHLIRVLSDDVLANGMSQNAVTFIEDRFAIIKCTAVLEEYYDNLLNCSAA
jgi:glycosyltransferase involved in cell wall biosynthesis